MTGDRDDDSSTAPLEDDFLDDDEAGYTGFKTTSPGSDIYDSKMKKLGDVLGRPYKVPDYQRAYTWKAKSVDTLWHDLTNRYMENENQNIDEMHEYLLGPVVFAKDDDDAVRRHIVDGQQRLVTLTLLFCSIRDAVNTFNINRTNEDRELFNTFAYNINKIAVNDSRDPLIKLNTTGTNDAYRHILACRPLSELPENIKKDPGAVRLVGNYRKLLRNAKEFCDNRGLNTSGVKLIKRLNNLEELIRDIKSKNVFVHITIENDLWAPHVFQSLNGKNDPLKPSALIKSYLHHAMGVNSDDADEFAKKWSVLTSKFQTSTSLSVDDLLYESALSRRTRNNDTKDGLSDFYKSNITQKHLYGHLKYSCKTKEDVLTYVEHLDADVQNIIYVFRPDTLQELHPANLKHALASVGLLNGKFIRRPIVAACRKWGIKNKQTIVLANWLHKYFFVEVKVLEHKIDVIKQISRSIVEEINSGNNLHDILDNPNIFDPTRIKEYDQEFERKFSNMFDQPIKKLDIAKYILVCIERYLKPNSEISIYADKIELEHIFPKTPDRNEWTRTDMSTDFLNRLGNLTILTPPYNKGVANKGFLYKKGDHHTSYYCYAKSDLAVNRDLMKYDAWNREQLIDREKSLYKISSEVWKLTRCFEKARSQAL